MIGWLCVAGLGPGDEALVTPQVHQALEQATDVLGYGPYLARVPRRADQAHHASDNREELERGRHGLRLAQAGRRAVIVSSGDPGVFAMAAAVFEAMEAEPAWQQLDVRVLPGVTAMLAAAARLGAPLGHDFCAINLSDNLKPWAVIERRLALAVQADLALALYNPRSRSRPEGFARALAVLRQHCEPQRWVGLARAVFTPQESVQHLPLAQVQPDMADMRTLVIVGSRATRTVGRYLYTPRRGG